MDRDDKRPQDEQDFQDTAYTGQGYDANDEWADQPVDDFADDPNTSGEALPPAEDGMEESADEFQQLPEEEDAGDPLDETVSEQEEKTGASGLMRYLPFVGGIAAVLVIGFLGWQQMSGMLEKNAASGSETPFAAEIPDQPQPAQTAETDAMPAPLPADTIPQPQAEMPASVDAGIPAPVMPEQQAQLQPTQAPMLAEAPSQPAPAQPSAMPSPLPQQAQIDDRIQIAELNRQLQESRASEAQLNAQVLSLQQQVAALPAPVQNSDESQAKIRALEEKIAQLQQQPAATASLPAASSKASAAPGSVDFGVEKASRSFKRAQKNESGSAVRKQARHSSDNDAARLQREINAGLGKRTPQNAPSDMQSSVPMNVAAADQAPVPMMAPQMVWLLRSAQPGSAWLSMGGSNNLRRVAPGDKVEGLGTIISIRQIAGRWVVEGTQGSLR